jgi:hypothetical protein
MGKLKISGKGKESDAEGFPSKPPRNLRKKGNFR